MRATVSEKPVKTNPAVVKILAGEHYQVRAARLDAALKAATRAFLNAWDTRHDRISAQEGWEIRVLAMTFVFSRWWSVAKARELAEWYCQGSKPQPWDTEASR